MAYKEFFDKMFFSAAKYPALTGLRALAAYLVFTRHFPIFESAAPTLSSILMQGYLGVAIFFVLSGFLIHQTYGLTTRLADEGLFVYFGRRFARIYPLYFVLVIVTFAAKASYRPVDLLFSITLLKGFFADVLFKGIPPAWSLTVEETFYLCAPLIFFLGKKWRNLVLCLAVVYLLGGLLTVIGGRIDWYGFFEDWRFTLEWTFFGRAFEFFAGIACSMYLSRRASQLKNSENTLPWATYAGFAGVALSLYLLALVGQQRSDGLGIFHPLGIFINNWFSVGFIVLLIYGLATEKSIFSKVLSSRVFGVLGKSSYAFYLLQQSALEYLYKIKNFPVGLYFVITLILSIVAFAFIEEPLNHFIRNRLKGWSQQSIVGIRNAV